MYIYICKYRSRGDPNSCKCCRAVLSMFVKKHCVPGPMQSFGAQASVMKERKQRKATHVAQASVMTISTQVQ